MYQQTIFNDEVHTVNIISGDSGGKCNNSQNVKLPDNLMEFLHTAASASNSGCSTVAREAVAFYKMFYRYRHKLLRYRKSVLAMLDNLP